jgi:hypothetical protein
MASVIDSDSAPLIGSRNAITFCFSFGCFGCCAEGESILRSRNDDDDDDDDNDLLQFQVDIASFFDGGGNRRKIVVGEHYR